MKYNRKIALCMLGLITVIGICGNTGHNVQASEEMVDGEVTVFDDEEEQIELEIPESEQNDFETDVIEDDEVEIEEVEGEDCEDIFQSQEIDINEEGENVLSESIARQGECGAEGNNVCWEFSEDGILEITGQGEMLCWNEEKDVPWALFQTDIKEIKISEGITSIGDYAFYNCLNVVEIEIPDSVQKVGICAFFNCSGLSTVTIG